MHASGEAAAVKTEDVGCWRTSVHPQIAEVYYLEWLQCGQMWTVLQSNQLMPDKTLVVKYQRNTRDIYTRKNSVMIECLSEKFRLYG